MKNSSKGKLAIEIIALGLMWGTTFVATTTILKEISIGQYLALRWGTATLACVIFTTLKLIKVNYKGKNLKVIFLIILLQPCIYAVLETVGLNMTTASEASIILALMPITIAVISTYVLRDKIKKNIVLAAIICIIGVLFTVLFETEFAISGRILGYLVLYACVLCGAIYTIIGNKVGYEYSPIEITVALSVGGGIFFTVLSIIKGEYISGLIIVSTDWKLAVLIIYLGVCCSLACFLLYNDINSKLIPAKTSLFVENLVTLVGVISAVIINGDSISIYKALGVLLLIIGIVYLSLSESKEAQRKAQ